MLTYKEFRKFIRSLRGLTIEGFGTDSGKGIKDARTRLYKAYGDFLHSLEYFRSLPKDELQALVARGNSHLLKDIVAKAQNTYVREGAFIAAAIQMGLRYELSENRPHVIFNL